MEMLSRGFRKCFSSGGCRLFGSVSNFSGILEVCEGQVRGRTGHVEGLALATVVQAGGQSVEVVPQRAPGVLLLQAALTQTVRV